MIGDRTIESIEKLRELAKRGMNEYAGRSYNNEFSGFLRCAELADEIEQEIEQAIAEWNTRAELGRGMLTAEQVREAIERHVKFYEGGDYDEQAIADELNAALGIEIMEVEDDE